MQITISENETFVDFDASGDGNLSNLTIGDPLTLDCTVTAVRGVSSSIDIIWTTGGVELRRVEDIMADIENDAVIYTDSFEISSLSAIDNGREYQCTVVINASQPVYSSDQFTLIFPCEYKNLSSIDHEYMKFILVCCMGIRRTFIYVLYGIHL